jgi:hypothetical protein
VNQDYPIDDLVQLTGVAKVDGDTGELVLIIQSLLPDKIGICTRLLTC